MDKFVVDDYEKIWKCLDIVNEHVKIEDVLQKWGIYFKETFGKFKWKAKCPLPDHCGKGFDGAERTPSFCVSFDNRFYCFGCGKYGSVVDLVSLVQGIPTIEVIKSFAKNIGLIDNLGNWNNDILERIPDKKLIKFDPNKTVDPYVLKISVLIRDHIQEFWETEYFEKEFKWIERIAAKVDELLKNIGHEDWEYVKKMYDEINASIRKRRKKYK